MNSGVNIKVNIFVEVFQFDDHPLMMVTVLWGVVTIVFGWSILFGCCYPSLGLSWSTQKGWSPPKEGSHHQQIAVIDFKNLCKNVISHFDSSLLFVKYLGLKMISELS